MSAIARGGRRLPRGTFSTLAAFALWAATAAVLAVQGRWEDAALVALALAGVVSFLAWQIREGYRAEVVTDRRSRPGRGLRV